MKCIFCNKNLRGIKRRFLGHCFQCETVKTRRLHYTSKQLPSSATKEQIEAKSEELLSMQNDVQDEVKAMQKKIIKMCDRMLGNNIDSEDLIS